MNIKDLKFIRDYGNIFFIIYKDIYEFSFTYSLPTIYLELKHFTLDFPLHLSWSIYDDWDSVIVSLSFLGFGFSIKYVDLVKERQRWEEYANEVGIKNKDLSAGIEDYFKALDKIIGDNEESVINAPRLFPIEPKKLFQSEDPWNDD